MKKYWEPYYPLGPRILCIHVLVDDAELASQSARLHWLVFVDTIRMKAQLFLPALLAVAAGLVAAATLFATRRLFDWIRSAPDQD